MRTIEETIKHLQTIDKSKIIVYDVETTGLYYNDEILQLSIINGYGEVLFNEYIKPSYKKKWKDAEKIHGISFQMVKDKPCFSKYKKRIQKIFDDADVIVTYNGINFDDSFISRKGIHLNDRVIYFDVMLAFAPVYGEWNDYYCNFKWQKLITCANYYNYKNEGNYHDSLIDVKATLFCFNSILNDKRFIKMYKKGAYNEDYFNN